MKKIDFCVLESFLRWKTLLNNELLDMRSVPFSSHHYFSFLNRFSEQTFYRQWLLARYIKNAHVFIELPFQRLYLYSDSSSLLYLFVLFLFPNTCKKGVKGNTVSRLFQSSVIRQNMSSNTGELTGHSFIFDNYLALIVGACLLPIMSFLELNIKWETTEIIFEFIGFIFW